MQSGTLVLDSEGLSKWCSADPRVVRTVRYAQDNDLRVVISALTPIEAFDMRSRIERFRWHLSRLQIEPVTEEISSQAIELLRAAGMHGHKYAIDAVVAATARRARRPVMVLTSDVEDLEKLCGTGIRVVAV
ncbi:DNA-binding protein [Nocardia stercoris]|uniref:DNA-binding protein n=2 Tax=Nocardia stercoris TaxID=2483361 RepID=A0A3M2KYU1_9NOCA|nr:DNA-binding protein [Nocardia stercoris]